MLADTTSVPTDTSPLHTALREHLNELCKLAPDRHAKKKYVRGENKRFQVGGAYDWKAERDGVVTAAEHAFCHLRDLKLNNTRELHDRIFYIGKMVSASLEENKLLDAAKLAGEYGEGLTERSPEFARLIPRIQLLAMAIHFCQNCEEGTDPKETQPFETRKLMESLFLRQEPSSFSKVEVAAIHCLETKEVFTPTTVSEFQMGARERLLLLHIWEKASCSSLFKAKGKKIEQIVQGVLKRTDLSVIRVSSKNGYVRHNPSIYRILLQGDTQVSRILAGEEEVFLLAGEDGRRKMYDSVHSRKHDGWTRQKNLVHMLRCKKYENEAERKVARATAKTYASEIPGYSVPYRC